MNELHRATTAVGDAGAVAIKSQLCMTAVWLLTATLAAGQRAEPATAPEDDPATTVQERLTVTDTRLEDQPREAIAIPAHVTVIGRDEIERAGVSTLQDLLSREAGVVLFDQVGNDISKTVDLRGFKGSGTRVFLDGAPVNEPRNNALALELVPLAALERVEITRGSSAALAGGGAEAGVINLWTRRGARSGGEISLSAGDFDTVAAAARGEHRGRRFDLFGSGSFHDTDGFRENGDGELRRLAAGIGWELDGGRRLDIDAVDSTSEFGNPGALTLGEFAADPEPAPFNQLDDSDDTFRRVAANYRGVLTRDFTLSVNAYVSERGSDILTTGRAAPVFGGFFLESEASVAGATAQVGWAGEENWLSGGVEWLSGDTDARGFFTSAADPGTVSPLNLSSDNTAERQTYGLYLQDTWAPAPAWSVSAGLRYDRDEVGYKERFPAAGVSAERDYSELSFRGGATWAPAERWAVYLSYGEGFLPPTVEELFSFPLFGSNPGLEPEDSASWELGLRRDWLGGVDLVAALFRVETENEIVFDPGSPLGLFGANVNAGEARRSGLELALDGPVTERLDAYLNLTLTDSELLRGANRGRSLPLVPDERLAAGLSAELPAGFDLRLDGLYVGDQVLDNDEANAQPALDAYTVVNARVTWRLRGAPTRQGARAPELFVDARNLFDEEYATRGIFAFDFSTFTNEIFVTPAPGRRVMAGVEWRF